MPQVVIDNPILNSPFEQSARHFQFGDEGTRAARLQSPTQKMGGGP